MQQISNTIPTSSFIRNKIWPARNSSVNLPLLIPCCCGIFWSIEWCKSPQIIIVFLHNLSNFSTASNIDANFFHLTKYENGDSLQVNISLWHKRIFNEGAAPGEIIPKWDSFSLFFLFWKKNSFFGGGGCWSAGRREEVVGKMFPIPYASSTIWNILISECEQNAIRSSLRQHLKATHDLMTSRSPKNPHWRNVAQQKVRKGLNIAFENLTSTQVPHC